MLVLPADLTRNQATACLQMLVQGLKSLADAVVVVDASALQRFDSSALAVLLELRRESQAQGKSLRIRALPERLRDLGNVYGIAELLSAE
ncbi:MAG: STAS domain-containing protein [Rhodoferax sp.]|nr:STAS domain-containing protein [Rhodoferax sp.]